MKSILLLSLLFLTLILNAQKNYTNIENDFRNQIKKTTYGHDAKAGKYCDIRGFKMYYEEYGKGMPLLLIHGNGGSINNFIKQIPEFAKKYHVIIADSRSQGKSIDTKDSLSYEMMADDYDELLTRIGIKAAYVLGWSDGGINGLLLAIRHPEKIIKLVVTGANLIPGNSAVEPEIESWASKTFATLKEKKEKTSEEKTEVKLFKLLVEQPNIPLADLQKIKIPVLVVGGDHDVIRPSHTLEIFQNIQNSYLWILPNSGHSTLIVYAEEFNTKVEAFFNEPYRIIAEKMRFF